jgi:outer membrane receptor protein involved in Fe transport
METNLKYPPFFYKRSYLAAAIALAAPLLPSTSLANTIEEVIVTADFRDANVMTIGSSVTVITEDAFARRNAKHLEDILTLAPNINFATGASRGRFIQIRGIGERSQFKDPLDPSVGLIVDGADLSGIGLAGSLMDTQQVEVLRGPQGTKFGASALAGAINIESNKPGEDFEGEISIGVGNYDKLDTGFVLSGPLINDSLLGRIAYQSNSTDGYIDNDFLDKDDTNNIDEELVRASLRWLASDDLTIDLAAFHIDADNGYNAFSIYNTRSIPADDPGKDLQKTTSITANLNWQGFSSFALEANLFSEKSDLEYSFDYDWINEELGGYRGSENNKRERDAVGIDLRAVSKEDSKILGASWVAGFYWYSRKVELNTLAGDNFGYALDFSSQTDTERLALYTELEWELSDRLALIVGGRFEQYNLDYIDSVNVVASGDDDLWGGKIALEYQITDDTLLYSSVSRGYKAGGVNGQAVGKVLSDPSTDADIADFLFSRAAFEAETLLNYEVGLKSWYLNGDLFVSASAFYMDRTDLQAKSSVLFPPAEWREYLDNIDGGNNYGLEFEAGWQIADKVRLFGSIGFLETELGDLEVQDLDSNNGAFLQQDGRDQAHAPAYQFNIGTEINIVGDFFFTLEVDGKDEFYFSNSHNEKSESYELVNSSVSYLSDDFTITLWGRNLTNRDYQTRGFYFANGPDFSKNTAYYQLGEPRIFGVDATYNF